MHNLKRLSILGLGAYFFTAGAMCIAAVAIDAAREKQTEENWDKATGENGDRENGK